MKRHFVALAKRLAMRVPQIRRLYEHRDNLIAQNAIVSDERDRLSVSLHNANTSLENVQRPSPFLTYHAAFDPVAVMRRHESLDRQPSPGFLTTYLGVKIDPKFFPEILDERAGTVEDIPIPANWHADIAEWGGALRAVDLSGPSFTVVELGCGWGCWLNNAGVAARRAGKEVRLIGVEGDAGHVGFALEAAGANGFAEQQVTIHHGVAAGQAGTALFPLQEQSGQRWGLEPVFGATEDDVARAVSAGTHQALAMVPLSALVPPEGLIDLLHIDIQGGEADFIADCIDVLDRHVAYTVIGTHSRQIEGRLFDLLTQAGWVVEIERPAVLTIDPNHAHVSVDGVQAWRNPRLRGAA